MAYHASKPDNKMQMFFTGYIFCSSTANSSQASAHQSGKMVHILNFEMEPFRH